MFEKSQLSHSEKEEFEEKYFGQEDFLRKHFSNEPIEKVIDSLYSKYLKAEGKVSTLSQQIKDLKIERKKLRNELKKEKDELLRTRRSIKTAKTEDDLLFEKQFGKIPPQEIELEEIVLASCLKHPELMQNFSQPYFNLMFYQDKNKKIHSALIDIKSKPNKTKVVKKLYDKENLDTVGGAYHIEELMRKEEITSDPQLIKEYVDKIEQAYLAREVIIFASKVQTEVHDKKQETGGFEWTFEKSKPKVKRLNKSSLIRGKSQTTTEPILDFVEYIRELSNRTLQLLPFKYRKKYHLPSMVDTTIKNVQDLILRGGKPLISTGYTELDKVTHGIRPNKLYLFGARPKNGKSTTTINILDNVLEQNKGSALFSYELTYEEVIQMLIAKHAKIDLEKFEYFEGDKNPFTQAEQKRMLKAGQDIKKKPIYIRAGKPRSLDYILGECYSLKAQNPDLSVIAFDGLQAFESLAPPKANLSQFYYHVLTFMKKDIAEELGVTVIVNAQLKGDVEKKANKKPWSIDNFSDCKGIPEVADGAFLLWRPEHYFADKEEFQGWINVHPLDLRRSGRKKEFKLGIDIKYSNISNYMNK
ncbi:MAG: DnaB-like helicase C-terminal domain-containing protein [Candidatus Nanoarchaeia archaeon]